ncbi:MAG: outer membrane beta-barrel protein [FCB group bacterium]
MKKLLLKVSLVMLIFIITSNLSNGMNTGGMISGFLGYNLPMGSFGDVYNGSLYIGAQGEYEVTPEIGLDFSLGFTSWKYDAVFGSQYGISSFITVPILVGARYHIADIKGTIPYGGVDLGMYSTTLKYNYSRASDTQKKFGFDLLGGAMMPIGDNLYLNVFVSYNYVNTVNSSTWIGLNAGVSFLLSPPQPQE